MRRSTRAFAFGAAIGVVLLIPGGGLAGFTSSAIDTQRTHFLDEVLTTSSTSFQEIEALSGIFFCSAPTTLSASLNVRLSGAPADFRVLADGSRLFGSPAKFGPTGINRSFSYTFTTSLANDDHTVDVQWRSRTGEQTKIQLGSINLIYDGVDCV